MSLKTSGVVLFPVVSWSTNMCHLYYLNLFTFLSAFTFQCRDFIWFWLNLSLCILFSDTVVNDFLKVHFPFFFFFCWCIEKVDFSKILFLYPETFLNLHIRHSHLYSVDSLGYSTWYTQSCCPWQMPLYFFLSDFYSYVFFYCWSEVLNGHPCSLPVYDHDFSFCPGALQFLYVGFSYGFLFLFICFRVIQFPGSNSWCLLHSQPLYFQILHLFHFLYCLPVEFWWDACRFSHSILHVSVSLRILHFFVFWGCILDTSFFFFLICPLAYYEMF